MLKNKRILFYKIKRTLLFVINLIMTTLVVGCSHSQMRGPNSFRNLQSNSQGGYQGHGSDSVSSETIQKFAATPLPIDLQTKLQKYLDIRAPGAGVMTPNGRQMFMSWNVTGTPQIWRLDGPMQFPKQMTAGKDATSVVGMSVDGKWVFLSRDVNGQENPGLYYMSVEGGDLRTIAHKPKVQVHLQWIAEDGVSIYYAANDVAPDSYALYRYDLTKDQSELVFSEPGLWEIADVHTDGKFLLAKSTGALWQEYYVWDGRSKALQPVLGVGEKEEYSVHFGRKSNEFLVLTDKWGEFRRLYHYDLKKFTPLTPDVKWDVQSFTLDHPRQKLYIVSNEKGYSKLAVYEMKTMKRLAFPEFPGAAQVNLVSLTRSGRFANIAVEYETSPKMNFVYDWQKKQKQSWSVSSVPEVDTSKFAKSNLEYYPSRDGAQIPMFVRRPVGCDSKICPVIVLFHGGPEGQARPGFSPRLQAFIDEGIIVVEPNVRGSDGYGKTWFHADDGPRRLDVITDIEDAAIFIRKNWQRNGQTPKIGIMGGSYGGYSTLMGMTYFAGAYDAGAASVGMSSLVTFLQNTAPYRRILRASEYGDLEKDREALEKLSPINYIERIKGPLLITQGVNDPRVPVGEALQIHNTLAAKGVESELILFGDEGHGVQKRENILMDLGHKIVFFKKHLF